MAKDIALIRGGRVVQTFHDHQDAINVARSDIARHPRRTYTIARIIDVIGAPPRQR